MKLTSPHNKQKSNTKSKSKVKAGGKKQQRPLWQRITVAVIAFVLLGTIGSFGYYKWKERDLKAKAAAYRLDSKDYQKRDNSQVNFAICRKGSQIIAMASMPSLYRFSEGKKHFVVQAYSHAHGNNSFQEKSNSGSWFTYSPNNLTFVTINASTDTPVIRLSLWTNVNNTTYTRVQSNEMNLAYIPPC